MRKRLKSGDRFGSLTLLEVTRKREKFVYWLCACDCGEKVERSNKYLTQRKEKSYCNSCGAKEQVSSHQKHGLFSKNKRLYAIAKAMFARCNNEKNKSYKSYGGRGIKCEFESHEHFFNWSLENGYQDGYSIERIDVNGNYSPKNCKWIPLKDQGKNRRDTPELHGRKGLEEIANYLGISKNSLLVYHYHKKMSFEEIYELSKKDPKFYLSRKEKISYNHQNNKNRFSLSKNDIELALKEIENGKTQKLVAKELLNVDRNTLSKAIKRYKEGYYN